MSQGRATTGDPSIGAERPARPSRAGDGVGVGKWTVGQCRHRAPSSPNSRSPRSLRRDRPARPESRGSQPGGGRPRVAGIGGGSSRRRVLPDAAHTGGSASAEARGDPVGRSEIRRGRGVEVTHRPRNPADFIRRRKPYCSFSSKLPIARSEMPPLPVPPR